MSTLKEIETDIVFRVWNAVLRSVPPALGETPDQYKIAVLNKVAGTEYITGRILFFSYKIRVGRDIRDAAAKLINAMPAESVWLAGLYANGQAMPPAEPQAA